VLDCNDQTHLKELLWISVLGFACGASDEVFELGF